MSDDLHNSSPTHMLVGLGNPGRQYKVNRHNMGFLVLDQLARHLDISFSRVESKALICKTEYNHKRLFLIKPQTYMNLSGQAVSTLINFYHIPIDNLMVVYDDIDLPYGVIRLRSGGSSAGHKGMQSIIDRLGTREITRLRLGVDRPTGRKTAANYVLKNLSKVEMETLPELLDRSIKAILTVLDKGLETAMNQFNSINEN
ncbi:MAG: aminoacyl-tRNA hydrolase [Anaerolineales bacterium]|nr:aminoacyl-tRNA hydrolase [Anaerolineales bacterium]